MKKRTIIKWLLFLFMLIAFLISEYPLVWVVLQSLKTETGVSGKHMDTAILTEF